MAHLQRLVVYQKAHALVKRVDDLLPRLRRKKPRLADQMERAAESVAACIAEGRGRGTDKDFAHFLTMAIGSATELEHHLQRALDCDIITAAEHESHSRDTEEVRRMLFGLRKVLTGKQDRAHRQ